MGRGATAPPPQEFFLKIGYKLVHFGMGRMVWDVKTCKCYCVSASNDALCTDVIYCMNWDRSEGGWEEGGGRVGVGV